MQLIIEGLKKKFDEKIVLDGVDYTFESGKIYALLGRNGAGKTTFFNCLNEDLDFDGGSFTLADDNGNMQKLSPYDIGYVLSTPVVPDFLTAREFLKFFIDINGKKLTFTPDIEKSLDFVGIEPDDRDKLLTTFSHGMKNKMQLLVNIIANPKILLLDEPLTSFDVVASEEMKNALRSIKGDKIIIVSTHILDIALDLCDEIVVLHGGKLEKVDRESLDEDDFKNKIISTLKGETDV